MSTVTGDMRERLLAPPPLAITPVWARINEELIELVDVFGEEQLGWSPEPKLWNARGILLHIVFGRYGLMAGLVKDGRPVPDALGEGQTSAGLKEQLRLSWQHIQPFLTDPAQLDRDFPFESEGKTFAFNGHWLAFGQLEHDIHHRADLYHYLGLLGVDHGEPDTIMRTMGVRRG